MSPKDMDENLNFIHWRFSEDLFTGDIMTL